MLIQDLTIQCGAVFSALIALPGEPPGRAYRMHVRATVDDPFVQLARTSAPGGGITAATTTGGVTLTISAGSDVTEMLQPEHGAAVWVYDVESYTTSADAARVVSGQVHATLDVTRTTAATPAASALGLLSYSELQALSPAQKLIVQTNAGFTGGTGSVTAADITDATPTGRDILTGALPVATQALLAAEVAARLAGDAANAAAIAAKPSAGDVLTLAANQFASDFSPQAGFGVLVNGRVISAPNKVANALTTVNVDISAPPVTIDGDIVSYDGSVWILAGQTVVGENGAYIAGTDGLGEQTFTRGLAYIWDGVIGGGSHANEYYICVGSKVVRVDNLLPPIPNAARSLSQVFGDGTATEFTFTHNLNNKYASISLVNDLDASDLWPSPPVTARTLNTITLTFATAPATFQFFATIQG
jgi:hypothetical protein